MTEVKTEIHVTHGVITYHGYDTCTIKANGIEIKSTSGVIPGWHYGLIDYECDKVRGQLVSTLTCRKCGIYCTDNDMIEGCHRNACWTHRGCIDCNNLNKATGASYVSVTTRVTNVSESK